MNVRGFVRSRLVSALSHSTNGFNAKLAAVAPAHGVGAFAIDWTVPSPNFLMSNVQSDEDLEASGISEYPSALVYTTDLVDERTAMGKFSGQVLAHVAFILEFRSLREVVSPGTVMTEESMVYATEAMVEAVDEAMMDTITANRVSGLLLDIRATGGDYRSDAGPIRRFGDGYRQRLDTTIGFDVKY